MLDATSPHREQAHMKEFITAAADTEAEQTGVERVYEFEVDKHKCVAYRPQSGQLALLMAMIGSTNGWQTQTAGIINFFLGILDNQSRVYIANRLLSREDKFDLPQVQNIIMWLIEEWTGNPTDEPSGSTQSQSPDGQKSMEPTLSST